MAMLIGYFIKIVGFFFKALAFMGIGWFLIPLGCWLAYETITGQQLQYANPIIFFMIDKVLYYSCFLLAPLTFLQNIIRTVKKDRTFSLIKFVAGFKEKQGFVATIDNKSIQALKVNALNGVVFGKQGNDYITKSEQADGHILVIGGAGSGKTASIAIPTLMSWQQRVFAIDIKGELYQKTKGARNQDNIKVFNPSERTSYHYNPYYMLEKSDNLASSSRQLAMSIIPLPADTKDPYWIQSAQNLLTGLIIYFFEQGVSFSDTMLKIKSKSMREHLTQILSVDEETSLICKAHLNDFYEMDDKTLSGIVSTLSNAITVFATDSDLQRVLNNKGKCITPYDLENGFDIYCCIAEHKLEEWKTLLGMMCNQFLKSFEERKENSTTPILFLIDEFPRLGKIETISNGLATLRSKKIHIALVVQSKSQLNAIYGKDIAEVIADNCSYKAILKAGEPATQEWCSKLVGTFDKKKVSSSWSADTLGVGKGQGTSSSTEEKRIIKPEEFSYLEDVVCVFPNGYKRLAKANYYEDKFLLQKTMI